MVGPASCRLAIDGPRWSGVDLVSPLAEDLRTHGREAIVIDTADFLRPASVRLERGRDDPEAFYYDWYDLPAVAREVLVPLGLSGSRRYLPTLWDAQHDRATRAAYQSASDTAVTIVRGELMLGRGLPVDVTVHLAMSPAARRRRAPAQAAGRELPAFDRYDAEVAPMTVADVVVRCDDPRHLAMGTVSGP